jgi:hypothetical protein
MYKVTEKDLIDQLKGFPIEIVEKILEKQKEQINTRNIKVFQENVIAGDLIKGFRWSSTKEGYDFWDRVLSKRDFEFFFKTYPKNEKPIMYYIKSVKDKDREIIEVLIEKGGINSNHLYGNSIGSIYYINKQNVITCSYSKEEYDLIIQYGIELFLPEEETVKNWKDIPECIKGYFISEYDSSICKITADELISYNKNIFLTEKHAKSALAMAQISQLLPYYGGEISKKEWNNKLIHKHIIERECSSIVKNVVDIEYCFLAFHTKEQRDLFLKNNEDLIKQYYMIE